AGVRLEHGHLPVRDGELHVDQPDDPERGREPRDDLADLRFMAGGERVRWQDAGRVAGVDARLLDMLHHRRHVRRLAVAERVDVDLERTLEETIDERLPTAQLGERSLDLL